jgi:hypothetical protein
MKRFLPPEPNPLQNRRMSFKDFFLEKLNKQTYYIKMLISYRQPEITLAKANKLRRTMPEAFCPNAVRSASL